MNESPSATLESRIATLLVYEDASAALEALRLSEGLPKPGTESGDATAQLLFDIGFRLERFEQNVDAVTTYHRVLPYPVVDVRITAGAWFRIGLLRDRSGNWIQAGVGYRRALELAPSWIYMASLAQYHLAELVAAEENYGEAATLYQKLENGPPHPEIRPEKILLELGRCLLRSGDCRAARSKLNSLLRVFAMSPLVVQAHRLLAEIDEQDGDSNAAVRHYQCIVENSNAEPALKVAAAHRAAALYRSKR